MENCTSDISGRWEEVSILCPRCHSSDVLIVMDGRYYSVESCNSCGYRKILK